MKVTKYSDIMVGQSAQTVHTITEKDIEAFGSLTGDYNPLHFNEEWAKTTMFEGRIAHGLLTASFISTTIGMKLPGSGTILLSQTLSFKRPVRIGDTITARAEVVKKDEEKQHITMKTVCTNQRGEAVLEGEATVKLLRMTE
ncbi:MAG: enoyl-CoA hydratase [Candidatus Thorarchaeota archaeon]|nr:MAG: enoyl-CoA hydratase [Candidatus Thorarchaeota archaeon]